MSGESEIEEADQSSPHAGRDPHAGQDPHADAAADGSSTDDSSSTDGSSSAEERDLVAPRASRTGKKPSKRSLARELALQTLFQEDVLARTQAPVVDENELATYLEANSSDRTVLEYAWKMVRGVRALQSLIDERLSSATKNWRLERVACVDRCVLRLAVYEFLEEEDVPPKVVMDEAIELAKRFSTEQSGKFVNGILDRIWRDLVREHGEPPAAPETREPVAGESEPRDAAPGD